MTKAEKAEYREKTPIGVYPLSNWGGIAILEIDDDYLVVSYYEDSIHRVRINYTASGRSYFRLYGMRIYLDECMRTGR